MVFSVLLVVCNIPIAPLLSYIACACAYDWWLLFFICSLSLLVLLFIQAILVLLMLCLSSLFTGNVPQCSAR